MIDSLGNLYLYSLLSSFTKILLPVNNLEDVGKFQYNLEKLYYGQKDNNMSFNAGKLMWLQI